MSETASENSIEEKPVIEHNDDIKFPPFPDPTDNDFDDDIVEEERNHYREKFKDLNLIKTQRLHCSACDRHLGCAARNESRMRPHPMLRTLVCHACHTFYNSGEFEKGDDGSELYCRWCGQGGQVYCCSDCPHVFCAKCIRRNLGVPKIKEIEHADDWKCFKCSPKCLWDLRAICWAVLRYCDQKNKFAYNTQDPELKDAYQKDCAVDYSECCKNKVKKKEVIKKKEQDISVKKSTASIISKISPAIQVKKFASIIPDDRQDKKPPKRPASPKPKPIFIKNPIAISGQNVLNPILPNSQSKKIRMTPPPLLSTARFGNDRKPNPIPIPRFRSQKASGISILPHYNGGFNNSNVFNNSNTFNNSNNFGNITTNDNINLSLDNLTQGLDMAAVAAMSSNSPDDDVVCTPDLPLEPLCEVTEDSVDDDVQCITPGPAVVPKVNSLPQIVPRVGNTLPELTPENIVQMTENDVTVNAATGGLKFRVDPQTLSSNKMYRLPDGRIFAINANPSMPGGYSATIVAVTENTQGKTAPKGSTYAAKLSAITLPQVSTPPPYLKTYGTKVTRAGVKRNLQKTTKVNRGTETSMRECDLNVPIEWYRYNVIDAVDALEYSLSRLHKLKKEATTMYLRTRSISEMRNLHKTLDRLLNTSVCRFNEVRENVNKEMKQYIAKKMGLVNNTSEEDDDVEILPDLEENDDPIFIDENSMESNVIDSQEVDLTGANSEHNNSSDKSIDRSDNILNTTNECSNIETDDVNNASANITMSDFNDFNEALSRQDAEKDDDSDLPSSEGNTLKSRMNEKDLNGTLDGQAECSKAIIEKINRQNKTIKKVDIQMYKLKHEVETSDVEDLQKSDSNDGTMLNDSSDAAVLKKIVES
ncbi:uncharacterized protein ADD1 isoform X2 [Battus philenor]